MATTVHDTCLDLARQSTSRVERYLLLRLALRAEKGDLTALLDTLAARAAVEALAPIATLLFERLVAPRPVSTAPTN